MKSGLHKCVDMYRLCKVDSNTYLIYSSNVLMYYQ